MVFFFLKNFFEREGKKKKKKKDKYFPLNRSNSQYFLYNFGSSFFLLVESFRFV